MVRTVSLIAVIVLGLLWASRSEACSESCKCGMGAKQTLTEKKAAEAPEASANLAPVPAPSTSSEATPAVTPAPNPVAEKCSCQSAADCTCKKGQCKCKSCGGASAGRAKL
jgi:hypothetical protein